MVIELSNTPFSISNIRHQIIAECIPAHYKTVAFVCKRWRKTADSNQIWTRIAHDIGVSDRLPSKETTVKEGSVKKAVVQIVEAVFKKQKYINVDQDVPKRITDLISDYQYPKRILDAFSNEEGAILLEKVIFYCFGDKNIVRAAIKAGAQISWSSLLQIRELKDRGLMKAAASAKEVSFRSDAVIALAAAFETADLEFVEEVYARCEKFCLNLNAHEKQALFHSAVLSANVKIVEYALGKEIVGNDRPWNSSFAAKSGSKEMVLFLDEKGYFEDQDFWKDHVLNYVFSSGSLELIQLWTEKGTKPGTSSFAQLCLSNNEDTVRWFSAEFPDLMKRSSDLYTTLVTYAKDEKAYKLAIKYGKSETVLPMDSLTPPVSSLSNDVKLNIPFFISRVMERVSKGGTDPSLFHAVLDDFGQYCDKSQAEEIVKVAIVLGNAQLLKVVQSSFKDLLSEEE